MAASPPPAAGAGAGVAPLVRASHSGSKRRRRDSSRDPSKRDSVAHGVVAAVRARLGDVMQIHTPVPGLFESSLARLQARGVQVKALVDALVRIWSVGMQQAQQRVSETARTVRGPMPLWIICHAAGVTLTSKLTVAETLSALRDRGASPVAVFDAHAIRDGPAILVAFQRRLEDFRIGAQAKLAEYVLFVERKLPGMLQADPSLLGQLRGLKWTDIFSNVFTRELTAISDATHIREIGKQLLHGIDYEIGGAQEAVFVAPPRAANAVAWTVERLQQAAIGFVTAAATRAVLRSATFTTVAWIPQATPAEGVAYRSVLQAKFRSVAHQTTVLLDTLRHGARSPCGTFARDWATSQLGQLIRYLAQTPPPLRSADRVNQLLNGDLARANPHEDVPRPDPERPWLGQVLFNEQYQQLADLLSIYTICETVLPDAGVARLDRYPLFSLVHVVVSDGWLAPSWGADKTQLVFASFDAKITAAKNLMAALRAEAEHGSATWMAQPRDSAAALATATYIIDQAKEAVVAHLAREDIVPVLILLRDCAMRFEASTTVSGFAAAVVSAQQSIDEADSKALRESPLLPVAKNLIEIWRLYTDSRITQRRAIQERHAHHLLASTTELAKIWAWLTDAVTCDCEHQLHLVALRRFIAVHQDAVPFVSDEGKSVCAELWENVPIKLKTSETDAMRRALAGEFERSRRANKKAFVCAPRPREAKAPAPAGATAATSSAIAHGSAGASAATAAAAAGSGVAARAPWLSDSDVLWGLGQAIPPMIVRQFLGHSLERRHVLLQAFVDEMYPDCSPLPFPVSDAKLSVELQWSEDNKTSSRFTSALLVAGRRRFIDAVMRELGGPLLDARLDDVFDTYCRLLTLLSFPP